MPTQRVERIPACSVPYCPTRLHSFKGDVAEWHLCFVCQDNHIEHHDAGAGGMGGGKHHKQPEMVVALCPKDHKAVTTHECSDRIYDLPGKGRTYVYYDVRGKELCERVLDYLPPKSGDVAPRYEPTTEPPEPDTKTIEEGGGEAESAAADRVRAGDTERLPNSPALGGAYVRNRHPGQSAAAPSASPKGPAGEAGAPSTSAHMAQSGPPSPAEPLALPSFYPVLAETSDYCRRGMWLVFMALRLQKMTTATAFEIGDWVNEGEAALGEAAHQFFGVFSYWQIATWASVARRVPALCRHKELPFGHHQVIAHLPESEQIEKLDAAVQGAWKRERLREAVSGTPEPRPKRWTIEELRQERYGTDKQRIIILAFLDWLEAK